VRPCLFALGLVNGDKLALPKRNARDVARCQQEKGKVKCRNGKAQGVFRWLLFRAPSKTRFSEFALQAVLPDIIVLLRMIANNGERKMVTWSCVSLASKNE
jgi:hypothetical protein